MAFFEFPHTRTYDSDLGWLIKKMGELIQEYGTIDAWKAQHEAEYIDLANKVNGLIDTLINVIVPWDAGVAYRVFSVVEYQGTNYIAVQDVPIGIMIDNTDYWQPANTIVEQINAIATIVSDMQDNWCVVQSFSDLGATTSDRVLVLHDNSYYGNNQPIWYEKAPNELTELPYLQRTNGDYMQPMPRKDSISNIVPYTEIGETIASWIKQRNIAYGNVGTIFSADADHYMDCSTFVQAVLQGITYEKSRFVQNTNDLGKYVGGNIPKNQASYFDPARPLGFKVQDFAVWFGATGRLFEIDYNRPRPCTQLKCGDVLFENNYSGYVYEPAETRYLKAHHAFIVIGVIPESDAVLIAQCGDLHHGTLYSQSQGLNYHRNACRITAISINDSTMDNIKYYARPDYGAGNSTHAQLITMINGQRKANNPVTVSADSMVRTLLEFKTNHYITKNKLYTIVVKGKLPSSNEHTAFDIHSNETGADSSQMAFTANVAFKNMIVFPFVPYDDITNLSSFVCRVTVYPYNAASIGDESYDYYVDSIELYDGLITDATCDTMDISDEVESNAQLSFSALHVTKKSNGLRIRFTCHLTTAVANRTLVKLFTVPPKYIPFIYGYLYQPVYDAGELIYKQIEIQNDGSFYVWLTPQTGTSNIIGDITI